MDEEEIKQNEFAKKLDQLRAYPTRGSKYIDLKESVSKNVKNLYDGWEKIVYGFKKGILSFSKKDDMKTESGDQELDISDTPKQREFIYFLGQIKGEQRNIDMKLFNKYFPYKRPDRMVELLYASKSKVDNNHVVSSINVSFK